MTQTKRNYHANFILDNRGKEDSIDQLIDGVKKEIAAVQGDVTAVENLGRREFVRKTDPAFPSGIYVNIAKAKTPSPIRTLRLRHFMINPPSLR